MRHSKLLLNFPLGLLLGSVSSLCLAMMLDASVSEALQKHSTSLYSSAASLAAATLAVFGVFANISNQNAENLHARHRKSLASKALLPRALARFCDVSSNAANTLNQVVNGEIRMRDLEGTHVFDLPEDVVKVFKDQIELTENDEAAERLAGLLRDHQVFHSRLKSQLSGPENVVDNFAYNRELIVSWIYLHCVATTLFRFARGRTNVLDDVTEKFLRSSVQRHLQSRTNVDEFANEIGLYARTFQRRYN